MNPKYQEILYSPRPFSKHPPMSRKDRAAQFAPFAALAGHEESIEEVGRITESERVLSDDSQIEIKRFLDELLEKIPRNRRNDDNFPIISLTYFIPDAKKAGGSYQTMQMVVRKFDEESQCLVSKEGVRVKIEDIVEGSFLETISE